MIKGTVIYESAYKGQSVTKVFKGYIDVFVEDIAFVRLYDIDHNTVIEIPYERVYSIQYQMTDYQKKRIKSLQGDHFDHGKD